MTHVLGTTTILGHCVFHWYERQLDGSRTVEVEPHHCHTCVAELLREPKAQLMRPRVWPWGTRPPPAPRSVLRVLIVDDEDDWRSTIAEILRAGGYEVSTARNGQEALEILEETDSPSLVLLDLLMPVMGGHAVLGVMRTHADLARVPVIVVSGELGTEKPAGCSLFLRKPVTPPTLLAAVGRYAARGGGQAASGR